MFPNAEVSKQYVYGNIQGILASFLSTMSLHSRNEKKRLSGQRTNDTKDTKVLKDKVDVFIFLSSLSLRALVSLVSFVFLYEEARSPASLKEIKKVYCRQ